MNYLSSFKRLSRAKQLAVVLIGSVLASTLGVSTFFTTASAAQLTSISATASTTVPSVTSNYNIRWTNSTAVAAGQTITVQFDPGGNGFVLTGLIFGDASSTGMSIVAGCTGGISNEVTQGFTNNPDVITFTVCAGNTVTAGAKSLFISNSRITNPTAGSYKITIGGTQTDTGTTMVAILSQVTVTAVVDTSFTFTVAGVASGQAVNGTTTSTTTSATAIGFGTLAPTIIVTGAQDLTVTTNAQNGFVVTVHEDQNLLSGNGADIDLFKDGFANSVPVVWTSPATTLGNENTYGHFGLTSNDTDLNGSEFTSAGGNKWAGNFFSTTTRAIFSHTGPADGTTQDIGKARIGYQVQVSALQEAATDYSNHLIYVATPTF